MKRWMAAVLLGCSLTGFAQPAVSPEDAGITPITGDLAPWRSFGVDGANFENVWATAMNNGNVAVFKLAGDFEQPGVIGGSEFLLYDSSGNQLTQLPVRGSFTASGDPTPLVDFTASGEAWGSFTMGAHADRANGAGFVVHNEGAMASFYDMEFADEVGDETFSLIQIFDNDGNPAGSSINAFGDLTGAPGGFRDIGALFLSNGDIVSLGENRQGSDPFLDSIGASAGEVAMAVILSQNGEIKAGPFAPHTDENGQYLGGSSTAVYHNMAAFDGGFVIDYGSGIRWYDNDGTPRTPSQPDHADIFAEDADPNLPGFFLIPENTGGRGDGSSWASNGADLVVKTTQLSEGPDTIGLLIYYNTDGTVRNWVRFDDIDIAEEVAMVDRSFCDMDQNGNVFIVWEDERFGGDSDEGYTQVFGRFFNKDGDPYGPSFPVYENWIDDPVDVDYSPFGSVPAGVHYQPRCALNNDVAVVVSGSTILPDIPGLYKELSAAFDLVLSDVVVRMFENPGAEENVERWSLY